MLKETLDIGVAYTWLNTVTLLVLIGILIWKRRSRVKVPCEKEHEYGEWCVSDETFIDDSRVQSSRKCKKCDNKQYRWLIRGGMQDAQ